MRKVAIALFAVFVTLALAGCGGGGTDTATTPSDATEQPAAPVAAPVVNPGQAGTAAPVEDRSAVSGEVFEVFPSDSDVPTEVADRLASHQAMIIVFYNEGQPVTDDVRKQIKKVVDDNRGMIDLISYNLSKTTKIAKDGQIAVDDKELRENPKDQQAILFAKLLGVDHEPYIVVVDDQGYKIFWSRGFIDQKMLERQVERAAQ